MNKVRYLGVYLVSSKAFSCNYDLMKQSFYRAFNAIYGKVGRLVSVDVVIELFKTKCMPILLYGLDACPVSPRQLRSLNHVVVSCSRKIFNVNNSEIAAECLKIFGVSDVAEALATRKDRLVKAPFARYNRLSKRLYNRLLYNRIDNRLYRVNGV